MQLDLFAAPVQTVYVRHRWARRYILRGGALKASVAYFPESYGMRLLKLAIKICEGEHPPLVTHTDHTVLTVENLADFYPQKDEPPARD